MTDEDLERLLLPIPTHDLKGRRFIFSARLRAAKAAQAASTRWLADDPASYTSDGHQIEYWSYVVNQALEALTDGEDPEL